MGLAGIACYVDFTRHREVEPSRSLWLTAIVVLTPSLVFLAASTVMSECVFIAAQMAGLLAVERAVRTGSATRRPAVAAGLLAARRCLVESLAWCWLGRRSCTSHSPSVWTGARVRGGSGRLRAAVGTLRTGAPANARGKDRARWHDRVSVYAASHHGTARWSPMDFRHRSTGPRRNQRSRCGDAGYRRGGGANPLSPLR